MMFQEVGLITNFRICIIIESAMFTAAASSMFSLVAVSIDRYCAICRPMSYKTKNTKNTKLFIIHYWIVACIINLPPIYNGWNKDIPFNIFDSRLIANFNGLLLVCAFPILMTIIMVIFYSLVFCEILKQVSTYIDLKRFR